MQSIGQAEPVFTHPRFNNVSNPFCPFSFTGYLRLPTFITPNKIYVAVLLKLGVPGRKLIIDRDTVRKATNGVKHNVAMDVIAQLPELLHDPLAVFDSKTQPNAKVILIDAKDDSGRPVIVALHINAIADRLQIIRIASVYGKDGGYRMMTDWIGEGLLRYAKDEENALGTTQGLQLPKRGSPMRVSGVNLLSKEDIVNFDGDLNFSKTRTSAANITDTPAFKRWFAGSKVVDEKNSIKNGYFFKSKVMPKFAKFPWHYFWHY